MKVPWLGSPEQILPDPRGGVKKKHVVLLAFIIIDGYTETRVKEMANDEALQRAIEEMKGITPYSVASKSGTDFDGKRLRIPFFNRVFLVHHPDTKIIEEGKSVPVPQY